MSLVSLNQNITIALSVKDRHASADWYKAMLGFELLYHADEAGWSELQTNTLGVTLGLGEHTKPAPGNCVPVFGLTGALLPIAAQNYGAGKHDRVRQALFDCWKFGWMFMAVACPILFFASPLLMRTFTPDPEVIAIGVSYLRVDGFILPVYMMLFAINSFLQALKRPIWTFWIGVYRQAFGVAFFVYVYVMLFHAGVMGVWFGIATAVVTGLMISLVVAEYVAKDTIGGLLRRLR